MSRWWHATVGLVLALGCTRYGVNPPGGPFARSDGRGPFSPATSDGELGRRGRNGEEVIPASGRVPERRPLLPRRRATPLEPLPSPYARDAAPPVIPPADAGLPPPPPLPPAGPPPEGIVTPSSPAAATPPPFPAASTPPSRPSLPETPPASPAPSAPSAPPAPAPAAPATADQLAAIRQLLRTAQQRWATIDTYEAIVVRRELAPNKQRTYDRVFYQFRKEPFAVYMRNLDEANAGRELLYNPQQHGDKIYAVVGKADEGLLYKAGQRAPAVSPDFPMVKQKSRYSIREAGLGTPLQRVQQWLEKAERGQIPSQNLRFQQQASRSETTEPLHLVELVLRPGDDPLLPRGGRRQWFFHANPRADSYALPILIRAVEADDQEVEYYWIEQFRPNVRLSDADFHPDRLGGSTKAGDSREPKRLPKK